MRVPKSTRPFVPWLGVIALAAAVALTFNFSKGAAPVFAANCAANDEVTEIPEDSFNACIEKDASVSEVTAGGDVVWTITGFLVWNDETAPPGSFVLFDTLPPGFTIDTYTAPIGASCTIGGSVATGLTLRCVVPSGLSSPTGEGTATATLDIDTTAPADLCALAAVNNASVESRANSDGTGAVVADSDADNTATAAVVVTGCPTATSTTTATSTGTPNATGTAAANATATAAAAATATAQAIINNNNNNNNNTSNNNNSNDNNNSNNNTNTNTNTNTNNINVSVTQPTAAAPQVIQVPVFIPQPQQQQQQQTIVAAATPPPSQGRVIASGQGEQQRTTTVVSPSNLPRTGEGRDGSNGVSPIALGGGVMIFLGLGFLAYRRLTNLR